MSHTPRPKIVAIVGPTASGKTALSIELAKRFAGEVISADSRQVYRGLDIGTGKVTAEEMQNIPHHLLDVADPTTIYTATDFAADAQQAIADITHRHKLPVVAGGTFFYLDILRGRRSAAPVPPNAQLRTELETKSTEVLFATLGQLAPARASTIDPHNRRRLVRALEIHAALGHIPDTSIDPTDSPYEWLMIGLEVQKEQLQANYAARAREWLGRGLLDEVRTLLASNISPARLHELGFEYQLALKLLQNTISQDEFIERFIQKNWQYAKRQLTWLKRDEAIEWHRPKDHEAILGRVATFLSS